MLPVPNRNYNRGARESLLRTVSIARNMPAFGPKPSGRAVAAQVITELRLDFRIVHHEVLHRNGELCSRWLPLARQCELFVVLEAKKGRWSRGPKSLQPHCTNLYILEFPFERKPKQPNKQNTEGNFPRATEEPCVATPSAPWKVLLPAKSGLPRPPASAELGPLTVAS